MYYLDTCVLMSYVFASEPKHLIVTCFLNKAVKSQETLHVSILTILEFLTAGCRRIIGGQKLIDLLGAYVSKYPSDEDKCRFFRGLVLHYIVNGLQVGIIGCGPLSKLHIECKKIECLRVQEKALDLFHKIRLKYADILHLLYAQTIAGKEGIKFLTSDESFLDFSNQIKTNLQIEIEQI